MAAPMRNGTLKFGQYFLTNRNISKPKRVFDLFRKHGFLSNLQCYRMFGQPAYQTHPHLVKEGEVTPGIGIEEYKLRRTSLVSTAAHNFSSIKDHIFIFPSATKVYMTNDIPYNFRQNTEFLYLSGFQEPDSVLVLHTTSNGYNSVLFVPKRDPEKELWDGPRSGDTGARQLTGVTHAFNIDHLETYLYDYCKNYPSYMVWYNHSDPVHQQFNKTIFSEFLKTGSKKGLENPESILQRLRVVKSNAEIELMKKTTEIASHSFIEVMKYSCAGVNEAHLYAKMDFECRIRGAEILAYPPVVAGGNRANTIHYINNNQLIQDGDLVLMDAGCEYHGYTSDITRTWPVSGKFTEAQRRVYDAVLDIQEKLIAMCVKNNSLVDIYLAMMHHIGVHLIQLGIIHNDKHFKQRAADFCPHNVGHFLGMDVHDTPKVSKHTKFVPGMIITIEPGIYLDAQRSDIPEMYRGIGIRIEDNILVTKSVPYNLTASCPKHPDDIERIVQQK